MAATNSFSDEKELVSIAANGHGHDGVTANGTAAGGKAEAPEEKREGWRHRRPPLLVRLLILAFVAFFIYHEVNGTSTGCRGWRPAAASRSHASAAGVPFRDQQQPSDIHVLEKQLGTNPDFDGRRRPGGSTLLPHLSRAQRFISERLGRTRRQLGGGGGGGGGIIPGFPGLGPPRQVLEVFQVAQPVLQQTSETIDAGVAEPVLEECKVLLMDHVFANSYGKPFIGNYVPPSCEFNRVVMNFSAVAAGRQFDRLAIMYLNDTEVWRTSTPEPNASPGIHWEYQKDMTPFLSLWKQPQRIVFDLGNLVNDVYTSPFNTTLTAHFFMSAVQTASEPPADLIIPISNAVSGGGSDKPIRFNLPEQEGSSTIAAFPRNANRAVLTISANGQASEEFWWDHVPQSDRFTFNATAGEAGGYSPWREVQALIDGQLAGVQWPFPVIFTGGIVPAFHRPIVGLQAFDIREHEIDITPWLPLLCDGNPHTVSFIMSGLDDDGNSKATPTNHVGQDWYVSGKIFVWLDDEGSITTGTPPQAHGVDPVIQFSRQLEQNPQGLNQTLVYTVAVQRDITISATVVTQHSSGAAAWKQTLAYSTTTNISSAGLDQLTDFTLRGSDTASRNGTEMVYGADYSYPLRSNTQSQYGSDGSQTTSSTLYQGFSLQVAGGSVFPDGLAAFASRTNGNGSASAAAARTPYLASTLSTFRDGSASFSRGGNRNARSVSRSNVRQEFSFGGNYQRYDPSETGGNGYMTPDVMLYFRNVTQVNDAVTRDRISVVGKSEDSNEDSIDDDNYNDEPAPPSSPREDDDVGDAEGQLVFSAAQEENVADGLPLRFGPFPDLATRQRQLQLQLQQT